MRDPFGEMLGLQVEILKQTVGLWQRVLDVYTRNLPRVLAASMVPVPVETRRRPRRRG